MCDLSVRGLHRSVQLKRPSKDAVLEEDRTHIQPVHRDPPLHSREDVSLSLVLPSYCLFSLCETLPASCRFTCSKVQKVAGCEAQKERERERERERRNETKGENLRHRESEKEKKESKRSKVE